MDAFKSLITGAKFDKKKSSRSLSLFSDKGDKPYRESKYDLSDIFSPSGNHSNNNSNSSVSHQNHKKNKSKSDVNDNDNSNNNNTNNTSNNDSDGDVGGGANPTNNNNNNKKTNTIITKTLHNVEEINAFRNRLQIKVKGDDIPSPQPTFQEMKLSKEIKAILLRNIEQSHWKEPTAIQMQAIPVQLLNRDILAAAPTGSGKTAAYLIPVLSKLAPIVDMEANSSVISATQSKPSSNNNDDDDDEKDKKGKTSLSRGTGLKAIILAPTKELADQIDREVSRLKDGKKIKVCNLRKPVVQQATKNDGKTFFNKYDILIATPLRLVSVIRAGAIDLHHVRTIILDEADKLLELDTIQIRKNAAEDRKQSSKKKKRTRKNQDEDSEGDEEEEEEEEGDGDNGRIRSSFLAQVDEILAEIPSSNDVQRVLFSATLGPFVLELAQGFLRNPIHVTIGTENAGASTVEQKLVFVGREDGKLLAIRQLIQEGLRPPVLIFVQSVPRAKELYKELIYDGINVEVMHAMKSSSQRDEVIRRFRIGEIWVLICTDLMARGIDFQTVQMVINYDLPLSAVSYIHRIGRTGRAGRTGKAVTFFTEQDIPRLRPIANVVKLSGGVVPDWMLTIKSMSTRNKRKLRQSAPKRRRISTNVAVNDED